MLYLSRLTTVKGRPEVVAMRWHSYACGSRSECASAVPDTERRAVTQLFLVASLPTLKTLVRTLLLSTSAPRRCRRAIHTPYDAGST